MTSKLPRILPVAALVTLAADTLPAQRHNLACVVTFEAQNRNRTVDGFVNVECTLPHTRPWGNWGVDSNYGRRKDSDQFKGWKWTDRKPQWNSCTTGRIKFHAPSRDYYNTPPDYRSQHSNSRVTHGAMVMAYPVECVEPWDPRPPVVQGCSSLEGEPQRQGGNYMTLFELDWPDPDDFITRLHFPDTSATFRGCDYDECPEQTSDWVGVTESTAILTGVDAEFRMKISAEIWGSCNWDWMP